MPQRIIPLTDEEILAVMDEPTLVGKMTADERRRMWILRQPAPTPPQPAGQVVQNAIGGAMEFSNPLDLLEAGLHPIETAKGVVKAQLAEAGQARTAPTLSERLGHGAAALLPVLGPAAAQAGETIASGDVARGVGQGLALTSPALVKAVPPASNLMRAVPSGVRGRAATALEGMAEKRVVDVMAPQVGANKSRFGDAAAKIAPNIVTDLRAAPKAPWTREGLHDLVGQKLTTAEQGLDAAADARFAAKSIETQSMIDSLLARRRELTSEAVEGSVNPRTPVTRTSPIVDERGQPMTVTDLKREPIGHDVVPAPNRARVAVIDQAIAELRQLGPVTRYDPIRVMRQAYDGPAKAIYHPSMTADFLKAQGGKLGAADVTAVLREELARADPATAVANADYHIYRTANDVLEATREVERTRPRVGRAMMARLTGVLGGQHAAGVPGAITGYVLAPVVDAALSSGMTTKLKFARLQSSLADAIRRGQIQQVDGLVKKLTALQIGTAMNRAVEAQSQP